MARRWSGVAGVALATGVASLALANRVSSGAAHRGAVAALFLSFLAATFTLLAVAVASSDRVVDEHLAVGRHWSRRGAARGGFGRTTTATRTAFTNLARASGAGAGRVQAALTRAGNAVMDAIPDERRRTTRAALERAGHRTLVALGFTETDVRPTPPPTRPRPRPRALHVPSTRRTASYHWRARDLAYRRQAALRR